MSLSDAAPEQACPGCGRVVNTAGLEPFGKIECPGCGTQLRVERVFESYKVVEPLGSGGMGSVFKARDLRLNRFVALKILRREFAAEKNFTAKLQEEARITASIRHPHVVEVYSVGEEHGQFYVVMELVDGGSLDDRIEDEKRVSELQALNLGLQIARGLQAALDAGLIHRDIKPGNILFGDRNTAKIVDFGLALFAEQHAESEGEIWGTPYYVAPERLTNEREDFRSDLYSLGATLFHAIAGRPSFESETTSAVELKKLKASPTPLRELAPDVSSETAAVIDRMLRPEPADRQGSYRELIDELGAARGVLLAREEKARTRWSWRGRVLVSLGVFIFLAALFFGVVFGLRHLPQKNSVTISPTPLPVAQIDAARREFDAGRYAEAETRFQTLATDTPVLQAMTNLCSALELWEQDDFAEAAAGLRTFAAAKFAAPFLWENNYRPLARERLHDYALYRDWEQRRGSLPNDPEKALANLRRVIAQLKTKGALNFRLTDEETALAANSAEFQERRAAEAKQRAVTDEKLAATETPVWQSAESAARNLEAAYRFADALAILRNARATATTLVKKRELEMQCVVWLADWKNELIADINRTGFGGAVTDIHGLRYDGPVQRADAKELELKTRYGGVMTRWQNLSPQMLLAMSTAFIQPGVPDLAKREWLIAIFARQNGLTNPGNELARKAADADAKFRDELPRFFPDAEK
jgi:hypothetical protein